jgi:hypothetical protein
MPDEDLMVTLSKICADLASVDKRIKEIKDSLAADGPDPRAYTAKEYWTPDELADYLGRSRSWIYNEGQKAFAEALYRPHPESNKLLFKQQTVKEIIEKSKVLNADQVRHLDGNISFVGRNS